MKKILKINNLIIIFSIAVAVLIFGMLNSKSTISGYSMHPNYGEGDKIILKRNPLELKRGEEIIFYTDSKKLYPEYKEDDNCEDVISFKNKCYKKRETLYFKRIMAVEGDTVEIINNTFLVNGIEELLTPIEFNEMKDRSIGVKNEALSKKYEYFKNEDYGFYISKIKEYQTENLNMPKIIVKKGFIYVIGDNRDLSVDSRKLGQIEISEIFAKTLSKIM